ncbi:MAG: RHS repeat protein, partial [Kiritimatiellae bacterium]|nr:RHS repeat protein [Kiritimatiellia bacterium]
MRAGWILGLMLGAFLFSGVAQNGWSQNNEDPGGTRIKTGAGTPETGTDKDHGYLVLEDQTFHEDMPVVGTPLTLHYSSLTAPGNQTAYRLLTWFVDPNSGSSATVYSVKATVSVAGKTYEIESKKSGSLDGGLPPSFGEMIPNPWVVVWDGRDNFSNLIYGAVSAVVSSKVVLVSGSTDMDELEGDPGMSSPSSSTPPQTGDPVVGIPEAPPPKEIARSRSAQGSAPPEGSGTASGESQYAAASSDGPRYATYFKREVFRIGSLLDKAVNVGGWTLDVLHFYNTNGHLLVMGNGSRREAAPVGVDSCFWEGGVGTTGDFAVVSQDGARYYLFHNDGRHERTVDAFTGRTLFRFSYDASNRIAAVIDAESRTTRVERTGAGMPSAIIGPFGHRTELHVSTNGWLAAIVNPADETNRFHYTEGGLLTNVLTRSGSLHEVTYDGAGRALRVSGPMGDYDEVGVDWDYDGATYRNEQTFGRLTVHREDEFDDGSRRRTTTTASTAVFVRTTSADGLGFREERPSGVIVEETRAPDGRWGGEVLAPVLRRTIFPSGLTQEVQVSRSYTLADAGDPLSPLLTYTQRVVFGGSTHALIFDATQKRLTQTSAEGRVGTLQFDAAWHPVVWSNAGTLGISVSYDGNGRIARVQQGPRFSDYRYADDGTLSTISNAVGQVYRISSDRIGRVTNIAMPDLHSIELRHQPSVPPVAVRPPERPEHLFGYNAGGLLERYSAPGIGGGETNLTLTWSAARELTSVSYPNGRVLTNQYDSSGLLTNIVWDEDSLSLRYGCACGLIEELSLASGPVLAIQRDGNLATNVVWSGPVSGRVSYRYDTRLRLAGLRVNDTNEIVYGYDRDGLVTNAGALMIARRADDGRIERSTLGNATNVQAYNEFGELSAAASTWGSTNLLSLEYGYDLAGRITGRVERILAETNRYSYLYDSNGRLFRILVNGLLTSMYDYDANGNRDAAYQNGQTVYATFDSQDRMTSYGDATYQYDANGTLTNKAAGGQSTAYRYDTRGALRGVHLPDGTAIDYVVDALGRRIAKIVDGVVERKWIYVNGLKPVAELDGNDEIVSTFVYGTRANVP